MHSNQRQMAGWEECYWSPPELGALTSAGGSLSADRMQADTVTVKGHGLSVVG